MSFHGEILERGFWIYVCEITKQDKKYIYVGRTGDSSSPNAASPFNRIGQHLNFKPNAKGNSLAKRLREVGIQPKNSNFRMLAIGPIFPERDSFEKHKRYRDYLATIEFELANFIESLGYNVIGNHHAGSKVQEDVISEINNEVMEFLKSESG